MTAKMETKWTHAEGIEICAVCGAPRNEKATCCKTAPYIPFEQFVAQYFSADYDLTNYSNRRIAREFYSDYQMSDCKSLAQYIAQTCEPCF